MPDWLPNSQDDDETARVGFNDPGGFGDIQDLIYPQEDDQDD